MFEDDEEAEMDLEALKNEMFEDFESEKIKLRSPINTKLKYDSWNTNKDEDKAKCMLIH